MSLVSQSSKKTETVLRSGGGEFIKVSTFVATSDGQDVKVRVQNEEYSVENKKPVLKVSKVVEGKLKPENCNLISELLSSPTN